MLKVWNVSLICGAFVLALLGTFLVRSGILESIHAFGASTVGGPLLGLIAVVAIGSTALIVTRLPDLRPERRIGLGRSRARRSSSSTTCCWWGSPPSSSGGRSSP